MNTNQIQNNNIFEQQFTINRNNLSEIVPSQPQAPVERPWESQESYEISRKTRQQLIKIIQGKDEQIHLLTETLQKMRRQYVQKTNQAQLLQQNVAQNIISYNCLQKKFDISRQKLGLLKQINERLYGENLEMQKNVAKVSKQIIDIKQQMKAQDSANCIKLAQIRAELNQEKKKNKQHVKQISVLKALIKELQQELQQEDQDEDGDYGNVKCKLGETSTKISDFEELNTDENSIVFQSSFGQSHHYHHSRGAHSLPNSLQLKKNQLDQELQQNDIVFAQA